MPTFAQCEAAPLGQKVLSCYQNCMRFNDSNREASHPNRMSCDRWKPSVAGKAPLNTYPSRDLTKVPLQTY